MCSPLAQSKTNMSAASKNQAVVPGLFFAVGRDRFNPGVVEAPLPIVVCRSIASTAVSRSLKLVPPPFACLIVLVSAANDDEKGGGEHDDGDEEGDARKEDDDEEEAEGEEDPTEEQDQQEQEQEQRKDPVVSAPSIQRLEV